MGAAKRRGRAPAHVVWIDDPVVFEATYRGPNWFSVRSRVRARDKVCQRRGRGPCHGALQVNHIVPYRLFASYKEANALDNLELLCVRHHELADSNVNALDWHPQATWVRRRRPAKVAAPSAPLPAWVLDGVHPHADLTFEPLVAPLAAPQKRAGFWEHMLTATVLYAIAGGVMHLLGYLG